MLEVRFQAIECVDRIPHVERRERRDFRKGLAESDPAVRTDSVVAGMGGSNCESDWNKKVER